MNSLKQENIRCIYKWMARNPGGSEGYRCMPVSGNYYAGAERGR
jgi:hypothetical protein